MHIDDGLTDQDASRLTGHEQTPAAVISLIVLVASVVWYGVIYRMDASHAVPFDHWSWYLVTGVQSLFAFILPIAYPGYAVFAYTAGLGNDGPATRLEAFYINATMGMVLGIPRMAMVDHFMFLFAPVVMVLGWMPWPEAQVVASGLACVCGLYMALWIPTNVATNTKDPGPFILCVVFVGCSVYRLFSDEIGFSGDLWTILLTFNLIACLLVMLLTISGLRRAKRAVDSIALTQRMCRDIGDGPVWQAWPQGQSFPHGWWFEPRSNDEPKGWPFGEWPTGPSATHPPQEMIDAAAEEMRREMPRFLPLGWVLFILSALIIGLISAVTCASFLG